MNLLVINGPNLNMLGIREKGIYGDRTYEDLVQYINNIALEQNISVDLFQSNIEGEIVTRIGEAYGKYDGLIINAGAYTHYSIAIMDAIKCTQIPTVEVHLSNIFAREEYRHKSFIAPVSIGSICGMGFKGYKFAIEYLMEFNKDL